MSRGSARTALKKRVEELTANWKLTFKGARVGEFRAPEVYEQKPPEANDDRPNVPCILVHLGQVKQDRLDSGLETRYGDINIVALTWAEDSEQGYRDAENLIEALELDLIAAPWIDHGRYLLIGPWTTDVANAERCVFEASLACQVAFTPVKMLIGPDGSNLEESV